MRTFITPISLCLVIALTIAGTPHTQAQSILNPADPVVTYNSATPPTQPAWGTIGKWVRTRRLSWNTNNYKCYIYNGQCFRLRFPQSYNPTANDGKKYPILVFFHGLGERGPVTDNEYQLFHGGDVFDNAVTTGKFDGYVFCMQTTNGFWGQPVYSYIKEILDYMITNNKLDPFRISFNGLSGGGAGTWDMTMAYPQYTAASLPMSAASLEYLNGLNPLKYMPMWLFQGGLDGAPDPGTTQNIVNAMNNLGANLRYSLYPDLGHTTWDRAWRETDFFPFLNRAYQSNPWALLGRTQFCPGDPINITVGVTAGFSGYQWRKDGVALSSTTNTINVTSLGTYDCRVLRNGVWSDWSRTPLVVSIKAPTVTPNITIPPLTSNVIPALDTSHGVTLQVPAGYASYLWQKVGNTTTLSTTSTLNTTTPGNYQVKVSEQFGCTSSFSAPYTVIDANGQGKPAPAANLTITPISQTALRLDWAVNPSQQFPQTGFEIYQATRAGGPYTISDIKTAAARSDTATGLKPGMKYFYLVRAVNANAAAAASNEAFGTTNADVQPPTAPGALTVAGLSRTSAGLSWTASADNIGVTSYDIYENGTKAYSTTATKYTVYGLRTGNNYNFTVTARDFAKNISPFSNQVTTIPIATGLTYKYYTFETAPTALPNYAGQVPVFTGFSTSTSLSPTTQTTNYGFLWEGFLHITTAGTYQVRTVSVDGSKVYLGTLNGSGPVYDAGATAIVSNDGVHGSRTVTSSNLTLAAGVYPIAIAYFHGGSGNGAITLSWKIPGSGSFNTIPNSAFVDAAVVNGQAPAIPTGLTATTLSYRQIRLNWTDNSNNENGFEISRSTSATSGFNNVGLAGPNTTSFIDSSLSAATRYYYRIRAIGQYGESGYTATTNTITAALPSIPPAPTGLIARGTSTASSVTIRWTDNAANEDAYQVYRSIAGNTTYLPLATLPANTTSYKDTGLFANAVYYYMVRSANAGGASAFSNEDSAHTADHLPTLAYILPVRYMRYGTQLQFDISAADEDPEVLALQVSNLPAFGSFVSTGNGTGRITFTPAQSDQGVYPQITVTVSDPNGGSASRPFSLTVNNNYNPAITRPVANTTLNEKTTATVNLSATDQNAADILTWTFQGLPEFAAVTAAGGNVSLKLTPGYADAGAYLVQARVEDGNHGYDTLSFSIIVNDVPLPPAPSVYIHFDGPTGTAAAAPWNNTTALPTLNGRFANLKDQTGANSGIALTITTSWQTISFGDGTNTYGQTTGNNSGVYPDAVLGSAYYTDGTPQNIRISGLDTSARYNFVFFGSRGGVGDDRTSIYSIAGTYNGTSSVSLQTANNTMNTVAINNIRPNADSTLTLTLAKGANSPYGYLNAVVITKLFNDQSVPARPRNITGQIVNNNRIALTWIAAAYNANAYQVYRASTAAGPFALLNPGATNPTQSSFTDSVITQNSVYYYYVTATNAYGVSPSSDTVLMTVPNLPPVFAAINPISAGAGQTTTTTITATDAAADPITLQANGLPAFATFTDNGNGTGALRFTPGSGDMGSYSFQLAATDNHGATSTTNITLTVTLANLRNIYIHFNDGTAAMPPQPAPWNNTNSLPNAGVGIPNLLDDHGAATGFSLSLLDAWAGANNVGPTTGNNSGVYPDNVMKSFYFDDGGNAHRMTITGLSGRSKYNVIFYAGRSGVTDNRITRYSIGAQTVSLNAASNTSQTVEIDNVSADASGRITISSTKDAGSPFAYIGAIQLQYSFDTTFYGPTGLTATSPNVSTINLGWASNAPATTTGFEIWRGSTPTGPFSLLATVPGTQTTFSNTGLSQGSFFFYEVRALAAGRQSAFSNIAGGSTVAYTVNIQFNDGSSNPPQGGIWNSTNSLLYPGYGLPNMINNKGQQTGINLGVVQNFSGYNVFGATTGNNSGIYPDNVMQGFFYEDFGDTARLTISGLDLTSTYNFNFFGSRIDPPTAVLSSYQIGSTIVTQDPTNNTSRTVQIAGVQPDSTGSILITLYNSNGGRGYLNALTIDGVPSPATYFGGTPVATLAVDTVLATATASRLSLDSTNDLVEKTKVTALPNPFTDAVYLRFELPQPVPRLLVTIVDISGKSIFKQALENLPAGTTTQRLELNARILPAATYFIILQGLPGDRPRSLQLIKMLR